MEKTAMNRLPIKAYSRGESDNPNFPFLDYVIFPETQRILENPSADANANVAYLYFEAMKNAPSSTTDVAPMPNRLLIKSISLSLLL